MKSRTSSPPAPRCRLGGRSGCGKRVAVPRRSPRGWEAGGRPCKGRWPVGSASRNPWAIHGVSMPEQPDRDETAPAVSSSRPVAPCFWHTGNPALVGLSGLSWCAFWCIPMPEHHECTTPKMSNGGLLPAACNSHAPRTTCHLWMRGSLNQKKKQSRFTALL